MTNYWEKMKLDPPSESSKSKNRNTQSNNTSENPAKGTASDRRFEAYKKAHEIRQFEIGLFWQRATYYWAFILAAFTAHFALIGLLFNSDNNRDFSIPELYNLPGLSLFALASTAFFCFFFSLCWVLMNKGSKFWQKNWEGHIDELQNEFSGDLYKVIPNTKNKENFCYCPFSPKAYDFSVSKITMITSVALMIAAFLLFCFYLVIIITKLLSHSIIDFYYWESVRWCFGIVLLLGAFILSLCIFNASKGNADRKIKNSDYWKNIDDATR